MEFGGKVSSILAHQNTPTVWSVAPNTMVFDAIQLMDKKNVAALPVLAHGKLVGIVSERDYTRKVILKGRASKDTPVGDVMTKQVVTVNPSTGITECVQIMTEMHVRHLPVLDGTHLIGILAISDLLNYLIWAQRNTIDNLERYTLAEIKDKE